MRSMGLASLIGLVVILAALSSAQAQDDARAIIDKAIKAYGGEEKLAKFKAETWKAKGIFHGFGMKVPYTCDYAFLRPDKFRFVMHMELGGQKMDLTVAFDGKQAWEKSGDRLQDMAKDKQAEFEHTIYMINLSQLLPLKDKAFTLTALGESKVGDRPALGVKVASKGRRDVSLFFDKETGLLVKTETRVMDEFTNKEVTQETFMSDYKEINGLKYFGKMTIKRDGKLFLEEEFSDQKSLDKLDEKLFAKP